MEINKIYEDDTAMLINESEAFYFVAENQVIFF